jgi:hypothetical protein
LISLCKFEKVKSGYKISELFRTINNPIGKERQLSIIEAFRSPKLYNDLIKKFDNHAVPGDLEPILVRFHYISEKAARDVADVFRQSARFCGVLNDSNILNVEQTIKNIQETHDKNFEYAEVIDYNQPDNSILEISDTGSNSNRQKNEQKFLPPKDESQEKVTIRLSGKRYAYLVYPAEMTTKDIEILKKQIELIELTVT